MPQTPQTPLKSSVSALFAYWPLSPPFADRETEAYLAVAGEGGVVKQEVGTEEEDNSIKHTQACPVEKDRPAEEGVLRNVPEKNTEWQRTLGTTAITCTKRIFGDRISSELTCTRRALSSMCPCWRAAQPGCTAEWGGRWSWCCKASNTPCRTEAAEETDGISDLKPFTYWHIWLIRARNVTVVLLTVSVETL